MICAVNKPNFIRTVGLLVFIISPVILLAQTTLKNAPANNPTTTTSRFQLFQGGYKTNDNGMSQTGKTWIFVEVFDDKGIITSLNCGLIIKN